MNNKQILPILFAFALSIPLSACASSRHQFTAAIREPNANFILYVANQSYHDSKVNISVAIDDRHIFKEAFRNRQHTWTIYALHLLPGEHTIHAVSSKDNSTVRQSFTVSDHHWAVLIYSSPRSDSKQKVIFFEVYNEPIGFL
ncbi:MAG: hypothetical protein Q7T83_12200 [Thermodesulfovibrionales bacterium]|nr:hypothetical protein [Thermodesulfovibrionales bacterium]MDP3111941.1 hypothetical protein [Thermodesulfovibrionales bacterium]